MNHYYISISKNKNKEHELHKGDCANLPAVLKREYLGYLQDSQAASIKAIEKGYKTFTACRNCYEKFYDESAIKVK